jgi:hypothetical protein
MDFILIALILVLTLIVCGSVRNKERKTKLKAFGAFIGADIIILLAVILTPMIMFMLVFVFLVILYFLNRE